MTMLSRELIETKEPFLALCFEINYEKRSGLQGLHKRYGVTLKIQLAVCILYNSNSIILLLAKI